MRCKGVIVIFFVIFQLHVCHSADSNDNEPPSKRRLSSLNPAEKRLVYHSRNSHEFIGGITMGGNPIMGFGPKPRQGGLGPEGSVEISPWV